MCCSGAGAVLGDLCRGSDSKTAARAAAAIAVLSHAAPRYFSHERLDGATDIRIFSDRRGQGTRDSAQRCFTAFRLDVDFSAERLENARRSMRACRKIS